MSLVNRIDALEVRTRGLALWGLGQVGVAIKGPGGVLYVDPYLTDSDGRGGRLIRAYPPPLEPTDVTNATAVLLTHAHADHTDPDTIVPLASSSRDARFLAPFTSRDVLVDAGIDDSRILVPEVGKPEEVAGASVTAIPSAHTDLDRDHARGYPYLGYVIEWNGTTVYHAGDSVVHDDLLNALQGRRLDVAFLPINGRDYFRTRQGIVGNMDHREAAELVEVLDVGVVVPTHYDLIAENSVDPGQFVSYLYRLNHARRHKLLRPGELYYFVKETV